MFMKLTGGVVNLLDFDYYNEGFVFWTWLSAFDYGI